MFNKKNSYIDTYTCLTLPGCDTGALEILLAEIVDLAELLFVLPRLTSSSLVDNLRELANFEVFIVLVDDEARDCRVCSLSSF